MNENCLTTSPIPLSAEVQLSGHGDLEPVAGEGEGDRRLRGRRVPQHDLRGERPRQPARPPHARHRLRS